MKAALATLAILQFFAFEAVSAKILYCYYGSWTNTIDQLLPNLCTHMAYGFYGVESNGALKSLNWNDDQQLRKFRDLKNKNPGLKVVLSIGGATEPSPKYSQLAASAAARRRSINEIVAFLKKYRFDGVDLDWEYPSMNGSTNPADKQNFVTWLRELKQELNKYGYLLTGAVGAGKWTADQAYNVKEIAKHMDFINLMTYDFHGKWESVTGHNAPMYEAGENNVDASVNYWLSHGAPANKLVLGVPLYGRTFTLRNANNNGFGAPVSGAGEGADGYLEYNKICKNKAWNVKWSNEQQAAYATRGNQWLGFDNERSMKVKADYVKRRGLAGAMVWSLDTDDYSGSCGKGKFPLLTALHKAL